MKLVRRVVRVLALLAVAAVVAVVGAFLWVRHDISRATELIRKAQNPLPMRAMLAVIAVEDARFPMRTRLHTTANLERTVVAAWSRWRMCGPTAGASLTEQIVGSQMQGRPVSRLARQLIVSTIVDLRFETDEIATAYCNSIYFGRVNGSSLNGLREASSTYFAKPPEQLTIAELAALVASIKSPAAFSPAVRSDRAKARRRTMLRTFVAAGVATPSEMIEAEHELSGYGI